MVPWCTRLLLLIAATIAVAHAQLTFTQISTAKPEEWNYTAPDGQAWTWFAAEAELSPNIPTSLEDYLTNAGGQILDVTQNSNGTVTVRGYVPSTDSFLSDETIVELSTKECNLQAACTATTAALNAPMCALYPADMAYAGDAVGLVTDRAVEGFCHPDVQDCIYVDGPETATVSFVSELAPPSASDFHLQITWQASYVGPASVAVECDLQDQQGRRLAAPLKPLQFNVQEYVSVQSGAYIEEPYSLSRQ